MVLAPASEARACNTSLKSRKQNPSHHTKYDIQSQWGELCYLNDYFAESHKNPSRLAWALPRMSWIRTTKTTTKPPTAPAETPPIAANESDTLFSVEFPLAGGKSRPTTTVAVVKVVDISSDNVAVCPSEVAVNEPDASGFEE